jgi:hypothetical protein
MMSRTWRQHFGGLSRIRDRSPRSGGEPTDARSVPGVVACQPRQRLPHSPCYADPQRQDRRS